MGCILSLLIGICARAAVGYMYVTSDLLTTAFGSVVVPLVGFVFMPLSTLAYTWTVTDPRGVTVPHMLLVGLCVFYGPVRGRNLVSPPEALMPWAVYCQQS